MAQTGAMTMTMTNYTPRERAAAKRYTWEFLSGAAAFLLTFLLLPLWTGPLRGTPWGVVFALVPVLPVLWMAIAVVRHVRRVDELQRSLLLTSFAIGFGVAMIAAVAIALLGTVDVLIVGPEWYVFGAGMLSWGLVSIVIARRMGL